MNKFKKFFAICAVAVMLIVAAVGLGMTTQNASAYTALSENEMYMNLAGNALQKCYASGEMNASIKIQDYESYRNVSAKNAFQDLVLAGGSTMVYLPTGIGSGNNLNIRDGTVIIVNCNALLLGTKGSNGSLTGLFDLSGKTLPQPGSPNLVSQLADLGYTKTVNGTTGSKCIDVGYKEAGVSGSASKQAGTVCWDTTDLESGDIDDYASFTSKATYSDIDTTIRIDFTTSDTGGSVQLKFSEGSGYSSSCETPSVSFAGNDYNMVEVVNKLGSSGDCQVNDSYGNPLHVVSWKLTDKTAGGSVAEVSMENYGLAYRRGRNYFVGNGNMYNFAPAIQYDLYKMYLDKVYGVSYGSSCKSRSDVASGGGPVQTDDYGNKVYYVYNNGRYYNVTVPDANIKHSVATFVDNNVLGSYCDDFECLIKKIYDMNLAESGTCDDDDDDDDDGPTGGKTAKVDDLGCDHIVDKYSEGKIGAMQWILCPTMDNSRYTASWIDDMTQNWLEVGTEMYSGKTVNQVWGIIRNIANVLMIVFLSVIVFSQLTGYGIDNYGIKKMLPRLIVMAIIINLSLYICQIAVDLSNLAGTGIRNMFGAVGASISDKPVNGTSFIGTMITGIFASAGGASVGVSAALTITSLGAPIMVAVIVAVIVMCLVILVAVITLFLMLGAREIIIILCVVLSPLAFAAFILPNTQNLFKKWWDLFKAAIIIYPICGALAGISYMLRAMATTGMEMEIWGWAIMTILPYLGFFLIPMLLKNALAALGKVGGALTSMGQTIRNGGRQIGQSAMRIGQNTEAYKNIQTEAARRRQSESAERTIRKMQAIRDRGGTLNEQQTRQLARAQETQRKLSGENAAARTILAERDYGNLALESSDPTQDTLINRWERAWQAGDADEMDALTNVITSRHGPGGVNLIAQRLGRDENAVFNETDGSFRNENLERSFNSLRANMQQNSALSNAMQNKASDAYQMISSGGYVERDVVDANGNVQRTNSRANLATHSKNNGVATQTKDWATQSSATLRRAVDAGQLTAQDARTLLDSTDPAIQSGLQSDKGKREVLQAAAAGYRSNNNGNWNDKQAVNNAVVSYQHEQALRENAEFDRRTVERQQAADQAASMRSAANSLNNLANNQNSGGDNNSGQGFDDGAGI